MHDVKRATPFSAYGGSGKALIFPESLHCQEVQTGYFEGNFGVSSSGLLLAVLYTRTGKFGGDFVAAEL